MNIDDVIDILSYDLLNNGFLEQEIASETKSEREVRQRLVAILKEALGARNIEIGNAIAAGPHYVEFVAWRGSVEARIERALAAVAAADAMDKCFSYWLCLRENVDRYEGEAS